MRQLSAFKGKKLMGMVQEAKAFFLGRKEQKKAYFLSVKIINKMAKRINATPMATLSVKASLKTSVPMTMAVKGSKMPSTEVLVAPTALVAAARVMVAIAVGNTANPNTFSQLTASGTALSFTPKPDKANSISEPMKKQ